MLPTQVVRCEAEPVEQFHSQSQALGSVWGPHLAPKIWGQGSVQLPLTSMRKYR